MKDNINIYFTFVVSLGFIICILSIVALTKETQKLQIEVDELRVLFNQKFLQEMAVNKPTLRFEF